MASRDIVQPTYEVIKREDMLAAFRGALNLSNIAVLSRIETLIDLYSNVATQGLWTWGFTSRWDFDVWA